MGKVQIRGKPMEFYKWCETVKKGELVGGHNPKSRFSHIVEVRSHKNPKNSRDGSTNFSMFTGDALCGQHGLGYFWNINQHGDSEVCEEDDCKPCFRQWRRDGFPKLRNFVRERAEGTKEDEDLPFGWKAETPAKESKNTDWNYGKDKIVFEEVKVWRRGPRLLTVGKVLENTSEETREEENKYPLLVARRWKEEKEYKTTYRCTTMEQALLHSYEKMAKGGY